MLLKILLIGSLVVAVMATVKDGRLLAKAGLVGGCTQVSARGADGPTWQTCKRGRLEDYPDLTDKSCVAYGFRHGREYWRCPASLVASRAPRG
jgi:hypothetical protein